MGLTIPMDYPDAITRLLVMNTGIGVGRSPGVGFEAWKMFARANPDLAVGRLMRRGTPILSEAEAAAYDAPFPDKRYKAGVRRFPELVPVHPRMDGVDIGRQAAAFLSEEWRGESFMAIGMQDPVLGPKQMKALQKTIANCPEPMEVDEGGHFLQEWGGPIAEAALTAFKLA